MDMIIEENLPLRFVEKPRFRKVLRTASSGKYKNVCKKTVRAKVVEKGNSWKFNYTDYKSLFGKPATTVDLWSSKKRRGYMAVSIHLQSHRGLDTKVLDVAHIPSPHNSESIKTKYQEILAAHGLDSTDTSKVVSDNASNMKKAFKGVSMG